MGCSIRYGVVCDSVHIAIRDAGYVSLHPSVFSSVHPSLTVVARVDEHVNCTMTDG